MLILGVFTYFKKEDKMTDLDDISVDIEGKRLNCRAAGIIIHDGKVLFHKNPLETYYALLGGRVKICESSDKTVVREIKEELGKDVEVTGYVATVENFFDLRGKDYHEYLFVHQVEFVSESDRKITETLYNVENNPEKHIEYHWLSIDELEKYDIRPTAIKNVLMERNFPKHVINNGK